MTGTRISVYEIVAKVGAGGMGEVYRARDTRLNRDVAIKVLPKEFANDADRLARFTREAQTLAALSHPNIAHIHGLEESDGVRALVMELVEGEDLSAQIARGPIPLTDALAIARQMADALEAAHDVGIVHRDLKPANIKIKRDGSVKILDFGLAKAMDPSAGSAVDPMSSPTLTARATQLGMVIGTAAYMSPEQARGKVVDRRADIWAFGVVLYEMLSGRRAFEGDDISVTLAAVLKDDVDWSALPEGLPTPVRRLLRRCLEKDPRKRLSAIGDARLELDERDVAPVTLPPAIVTVRPSLLSRLWPAVAAVVVTAAAAAGIWMATRPAPENRLARLAMLPPSGTEIFPDSTGVAISPDGSMVAFVVGSVTQGATELWVRSLDTMTARRLDDAEGAVLPFWSPDSRQIGFFTASKLKTIAASGGRAQVLADATNGRGAAWGSNNVIVFAPDAGGALFSVPAGGGTATPATKLDGARKEFGHRFPVFLSDGDHFLYAALPGKAGKYDIFAGSLSDDSKKLIGSFDAAPVYAGPGWLLYARQGVLVAHPFDPKSLALTGDAVPLGDEPTMILDPATSFTAGRSISISQEGSLAYFSSPSLNTTATWYDAKGVTTGTLNLPPAHYETVSISPDGTHAMFVRSTSPSESSLWLVDLARESSTPFSSGRGRNDAPVWSPDGARVVFAADRDGYQNVFIKTIGDAAPEKELFRSDVPFKSPAAWSPDGLSILINQLDFDSSNNVWLLPANGGQMTPLVRGPLTDTAGAVSPDGRWLAYAANDTGRFELYLQSVSKPGGRIPVSQHGAANMWWTADGRQLVFLGYDLHTLWRVDVEPGANLRVGTPKQIATFPSTIVWMDATPDRQRFLAIAPERTGIGSITLVQNWREALDKAR